MKLSNYIYKCITYLPSVAKFRARISNGNALGDFDTLQEAFEALEKYLQSPQIERN